MTGAMDGDRDVLEEDAPELEALLAEFHSSLREVRSRIGPLVKEVTLQAFRLLPDFTF